MTDDLAPDWLAKATPRPWRQAGRCIWGGEGARSANICAISEPRATRYVQYTELKLDSPDHEEAWANATLIVAAVNAYTGRERENGARWRDKKSGSTYIEIGRARLRCFNTDTLADRVVIYRAYEDGSLWARPVWEFEDGRFELLSERSEPSPSAHSPAPDTVVVERAIMMLNDREVARLRAALDEAVKALRIIEEEDLDGVRIITKHALSRIAELTES